MNILIIGANGKIGRKLIAQLSTTKHQVRAMIRDQDQAQDMLKLGADEWIEGDLEKDFSASLDGIEAVIFTAGSGGHTGPEKTELVDKQGAIRAVDIAKERGISRFIMISSRHADDPENGGGKIQHYYKAKGAADEHLRKSGINYTIIRPGRLTDNKGTGQISAAEHLQDRSGEIPREDVASTAIEALENENVYRKSFDLLSGHIAIKEALASI